MRVKTVRGMWTRLSNCCQKTIKKFGYPFSFFHQYFDDNINTLILMKHFKDDLCNDWSKILQKNFVKMFEGMANHDKDSVLCVRGQGVNNMILTYDIYCSVYFCWLPHTCSKLKMHLYWKLLPEFGDLPWGLTLIGN